MVDDDRVEGAARNVGGKVKEGVGKLVGDEKLRREGQVDQVKGRAQNAIGGIKDKARDTLDRKDE
ncbi:MAG TPA: CsbD family protein [Steroidobacteraceae bacterium]|nr:CsbD family protein [Steroidobacteraceae bacterium]